MKTGLLNIFVSIFFALLLGLILFGEFHFRPIVVALLVMASYLGISFWLEKLAKPKTEIQALDNIFQNASSEVNLILDYAKNSQNKSLLLSIAQNATKILEAAKIDGQLLDDLSRFFAFYLPQTALLTKKRFIISDAKEIEKVDSALIRINEHFSNILLKIDEARAKELAIDLEMIELELKDEESNQ